MIPEFNLQSLICNLQSAIDMTDLDRLKAALSGVMVSRYG
jgi:hypothetical protein